MSGILSDHLTEAMADLNIIGEDNLGELDGPIYLAIRDHLEAGVFPNQRWRVLATVFDGFFKLTGADIQQIETPQPSTSSERLLNELSARGMTIQQFVDFADKAEDYAILALFNYTKPLRILQNPPDKIHALENDAIDIEVKATGFPPPCYQWMKDGCQLQGCISSFLRIEAARLSNNGDYYCRVYTRENPSAFINSSHACVTVAKLPNIEVNEHPSSYTAHWGNDPSFSWETEGSQYQWFQSQNSLIDGPNITANIGVKEHPRSCNVCWGNDASFRCLVWGTEGFQYQWFRNQNPLTDGPNVSGSRTHKLSLLNINSLDYMGCYWCRIRWRNQVTDTKGAALKITKLPTEYERPKYTASDKVALLIGCNDYRGDTILTAPKFDVQTLSSIFQSLGFKVLSLVNLSRLEMIAAVDEFKQLVGLGVYCVFYFCGHGFEVSSQCFLVPTDAPYGYDHTHCLSADQIFDVLLKQEPQICCMILDICRKSHDKLKPVNFSRDVVKVGNSIICYGTSYGLSSYEDRQYGILVSNLKNILALPIDIEEVFKRLREAIPRDPKLISATKDENIKQIPDIRTNLQEPRRSFTDKIEYKGFTAQFNYRQLIWEMAHIKPDRVDLEFPFHDFEVKVRLDFQQEFSNVLKIYVTVVDPGPTVFCTAYVSQIPTHVAERAKTVQISSGYGGSLCRNYVPVTNIQKLKGSMKITVTVCCQCQGAPPKQMMSHEIDLGLPLVSKLELWRERPDITRQREAVEQEDES